MTRVAYIIIMHLRLQCTHCREVYMAESAIAYSVMRSAHYSKLDSTQTLDTLKILYALSLYSSCSMSLQICMPTNPLAANILSKMSSPRPA